MRGILFYLSGGYEMLVYQTERLKEVIEQPTQLDIERIIDRRLTTAS